MPYRLRDSAHVYREQARVASTGANIALTAPGATIDGVTMAAGDVVLLKDQTAGRENGLYVWQSATLLVRLLTAPLPQGAEVMVQAGALNGGTRWGLQNIGTITPGVTALTWVKTLGAIGARAYHNAAQGIPSAIGWTPVTFNSERYDNDNIHDTVTNPTRLTCRTAGVYTIDGALGFLPNATGIRAGSIRLNGATILAAQSGPTVGSGMEHLINPVVTVQLAVNDYVELCALQNSGASLNLSASGNYQAEFGMVRQ